MLVTEFGIVTLDSEEQPLNAALPILVTEFGIMISDSLKQPSNVDSAMIVKVVGSVMLLNDSQL